MLFGKFFFPSDESILFFAVASHKPRFSICQPAVATMGCAVKKPEKLCFSGFC
jgi:hypothetical protein